MTSKFFTWTKGDRRNATEALHSGGVVAIPVECLKIKGMDYARSAKGKNNRKPLPLPLDHQAYATPAHSSRTSGSIALHDAAVQSATSLMAVMNDMLRSPQLSAHISSSQQSDYGSTYARPRSHTAPSTPLVEAPSREPAELPGSLPLGYKKSHSSLPHIAKNFSDTALVRSHHVGSGGDEIFRPHSSPQDKQHPVTFGTDASTDTQSQQLKFHPSHNAETPRSKSAGPRPSSHGRPPSSLTTAGVAVSSAPSLRRPCLSVTQPPRSISPNFAGSLIASNDASSIAVPRVTETSGYAPTEDVENVLLEEIARLRASQDEHVRSLKEAHEKELASQRSYIDFLEKRRVAGTHVWQADQTKLSIDTSHSGSKTDLHSEPSATTLKSFELSLEDQKRASQEALAETEALKRKLSLCRKAQVDAVEIRREPDHLRDAADRSDRRITQLKDIIRKAKENDRALRNQIADLEARLVEANNERIDVLEGFHDACSQVRAASERERKLAQDLDGVRGRTQASPELRGFLMALPSETPQANKPKHGRALSDAGTLSTTPPRMDPIMRQLTESRRALSMKESRIEELESALAQCAERDVNHEVDRIRLEKLESQLESQKQLTYAAQSDSERYNSLLHNELRRQSCQAARHSHNYVPHIEAEVANVASEKLVRLKSCDQVKQDSQGPECTTSPWSSDTQATGVAALLEKELDHCIKEIVMYKLDVKGYRKDLKKANAEIESLRAMSSRPPPTPDRDSFSSEQRSKNRAVTKTSTGPAGNQSQQISIRQDPGLGITLPRPPKTSTKPSSVAAATAAALASPLASPPPWTKTPLNAHKKLPKPPPTSRTPSPMRSAPRSKWPEQDVTRTETLRSLSESIISSYAKRHLGEPEAASPQPKSEPLGSLASPPTPVQKSKEDIVDRGYAV